MTKYQRKRKFIAKINARIKTLVNRAGVKFEHIESALDEINGVFITDTKNLNIDTNYFDDDLIEAIEAIVPTYLSEADRAKAEIIDSWKSAKNFVGPRPAQPTEKQINRNIRAQFMFADDFAENKAKFYEWADKQNEVTLQASQSYNELKDALSDFGQRWSTGMLNTQDRLDQLEALNAMGFDDFTKLLTEKLDKNM